MADSLPFNAIKVDGEFDRVYKAEDWAWYFATFLASGVFPKPSDGLQVVAYSGMEVRVNKGYAFINGYAFRNPAGKGVTLDMAEGALNRVDRVVVRWDLVLRDIYIDVLKGVPSAKPVAAALTRNTEIWELALADIYVGRGVIRINARDITDQRFNSAVCGIVAGTVKEIDASVLTKQFNDFFAAYSREILEKYDIYIRDMGQYLNGLEESGNSRMEEIIGRGEKKYDDFSMEIADYIAALENKGNTDLADITGQLSEFRNTHEAEFLAWFDRIKGMLGTDAAGNLANGLDGLAGRLEDVEEMIFTGMAAAKMETSGGDYLTDDTGIPLLADWPICKCC